jgi:predicted DNA binding CopG/RHH family protein
MAKRKKRNIDLHYTTQKAKYSFNMNPTKKQGVNSRVPEEYLTQCTRHVSGIIYIRYIPYNVLPLNI